MAQLPMSTCPSTKSVCLIRANFKTDLARELSKAANNLTSSTGSLPHSESYVAEGIVLIYKLFSCTNSFW